MGRKKRVMRIPNSATIKCPNCGKNARFKLLNDSSPQFFDCRKCKKRISTPVTRCCIICAFSKKQCAPSLIMEAKIKRLEIKYE